MIELDNIAYRYPGGDTGVFDIELSVASGHFLVVVGASGSGKTTLLKLLAGFLTPDSGRMRLDGRDITHVSSGARKLGIVLQDYVLFAHMTVLENIAYPLRVRGVSRRERQRRAHGIIETVGLKGREALYPSQLSGGQQQRVALARALVFEPGALLLDEPFAALDASLRESMRQELKRIQRDFGVTTLMITHDQEEAMLLGDSVAVLEQGRVLQHSPPERLYHCPVSPSVAHFIGRSNFFDGRVIDAHSVATDAFGTLRVPRHNFAAGHPVRLMIRPEALIIDPPATLENRLAASLSERQFLGAQQRLRLSCGSACLTLETLDAPEAVESVALPARHLHLFDAGESP